MALALGEDGDEHVGARHFLAARRLHMDHGALDDALEAGGRLGILVVAGDEIVQFGVDIGQNTCACSSSRSTLQARMTAAASVIVDQRQQQMLKRRVFMVPLVGERQRLMKRLFQALGESRHVTSLLLHHALQRMLILSGEIHDLGHFGLGHLECIDPALAHSVIVNMEHDACGGFAVLLEKTLQHVNHELHRRVVVVEDEDPVEAGLLGFGLGARDDGGAAAAAIAAAFRRLACAPLVSWQSKHYRHVFLPLGLGRWFIPCDVRHVGAR